MTTTASLTGLLDQALRELGAAGRSESACRIAAQAYALLERRDPAAAERFTGTLHHLTGTPPPGAGDVGSS